MEGNVYRKISDYAAANSIQLSEGYRVWTVDGDNVVAIPRVFLDPNSATIYAEQHLPAIRVVVTGPKNEQFYEVPTDRRRR